MQSNQPDDDIENNLYFQIEKSFNAESSNPNSFSVFVPDRNKRNELIPNHKEWVTKIVTLLTMINNGTTTTTKSGTWLEKNKEITFENTTLVESFIFDDQAFFDRIHEVNFLLDDFGIETEQSAVAFLYNGVFYLKSNYNYYKLEL